MSPLTTRSSCIRSSCIRSSLLALMAAGCAPPAGAGSPPPSPSPVASPADRSELAVVTLPPRPDWADKYAGSAPDERFFDIAALMETHGLDRARAVELQNHFRDLTRAKPRGDRRAQYAEALRRAHAGVFEDGRDPARLARAAFIVVFDLDQTLYDQRIDDEALARACHDLEVSRGDGRTRLVKLVPGWAEAIGRIHALGGEVVLFSANLDDRCYANARAWRLDGVPIHEHPAVAAFLTNSHLVLQPKHAGSVVVEPSKDLRILDPELSRVIIVDDNPRRLFQPRNVRLFKKFEADAYCGGDDDARASHAASMAAVVREVEDSVRYMKSHPNTTFVEAHLPYSSLGRLALAWLRDGTGRSESDAIEHLRAHPELVDEHF